MTRERLAYAGILPKQGDAKRHNDNTRRDREQSLKGIDRSEPNVPSTILQSLGYTHSRNITRYKAADSTSFSCCQSAQSKQRPKVVMAGEEFMVKETLNAIYHEDGAERTINQVGFDH